jgi:hypothetical protein
MKKTILTLSVAVLLISCAVKSESAENKNAASSEITIAEFDQKEGALNDYLTLKDFLIKSDVTGAASSAIKLSESLAIENYDATMIAAADAISTSTDLAAQRSSFKTITNYMIETLKANGTNQTLYVQYCPMAFNNTGASWISDSKEVLNPYFGSMMLKCGRVTEELK